MIRFGAIALCAVAVFGPHAADARDAIKIVGSSTVYPFTEAVAARARARGIPVDVKSTGTRGGFNGFCLGTSDWWPDMTGASRPITERERESCRHRGVTDIVELRIGYDGIVVASSNEAATVDLARRDLFLALAAEVPENGAWGANSHTDWAEVNPSLPAGPISICGPPPSSGTRQSFESLAMVRGCRAVLADQPVLALADDVDDQDACRVLRGQPQFIEMGEDDTEIVRVLAENADAYGIFGFSFAYNNPGIIHANRIDGEMPTKATIADGSYPLSRPLFLYVKASRAAAMPGMRIFLDSYVSQEAIGSAGYLADAGLVPLTEAEFAETRAALAPLLEAAHGQ